MTRRRTRSRASERGAVLVEFLIALTPLMITFSCFVQVSQMAQTKLVVKHSAIVGARAAAVITNKNKNTPDQPQGENHDDVEQGVRAALGPWLAQMKSIQVHIDDKSTCDDPYGMVTVTVSVEHRCVVPFGGRLLCGLGGTHPMSQTYSMPHQGARYADGDPPGADCENSGN